ncbi:GIY-YIG nuclease family protein [Euzebyella saccharophila]|uniref:GIY-YIG nuclease family protein n=1 Tax=Euzebyella saccharophila TaxID=679664 RepID=A0ABV8JSI4_9FLAO|nr:GIY-YIG nuclease family protein [Euzebyella saccharophila]
MIYSVYILYSESLDKYYVGHTGETIKIRLRKHLSDHSGFTAKVKDWKIVFTENFSTKAEAYQREMNIKKRKSRRYIESIIEQSAG